MNTSAELLRSNELYGEVLSTLKVIVNMLYDYIKKNDYRMCDVLYFKNDVKQPCVRRENSCSNTWCCTVICE